MRSTASTFTALVMGCFLLLTPVGQEDAAAEPVPSQVVLAQQPPPEPPPPGVDLPSDDEPAVEMPSQDRLTVGIVGAVLIALVLLSRRLRGKPAFFVKLPGKK